MSDCPSCGVPPGAHHRVDCPRLGINPVTGLREKSKPLKVGDYTINIPQLVNQWARTPGTVIHPELQKMVDAKTTEIHDGMERAALDNLDNLVEPAAPAAPSPLDTQVGGDHYKKLGAYQPWEVLRRWLTPEEFRGYMKGTAIAYLAREKDKGGTQDIEKAMHTLAGFVDLEDKTP